MMVSGPARMATLFVSVDIAKGQEDTPVLTGVLDILRHHRVAALWSLNFDSMAAAIDRIRGTWGTHEFGILAKQDWVGPEVSRTVFARELAARVDVMRENHIVPIALALQSTELPPHLDLLVKHQIGLVRSRLDLPTGKASALQPRLSRYGIWQAEPALVLPTTSRWSLPWTVRRLLQQAAERGHTVHVSVDGEKLATNMSAGVASLDYVLKLAGTRRDAGQLQIAPASQVLQTYLPRREQFTSRSVLRVA